MILVLNEWIFHDLLGENGMQSFRSSAEFLVKLDRSDDRIVMPSEERWRAKAYQLMTATSPAQRELSKLMHSLLRDTERCIRLDNVDMPEHSLISYDWAPSEDVYLLEAYVASKADLLVTTDETLFQAIAEHGEFNCQMRDDFLSSYGSSGEN